MGVWEGACPLYNWEGWSERSERNLPEATPAAAFKSRKGNGKLMEVVKKLRKIVA